MPGERLQFRILNRDFLSRMIDIELISASGDARDLIIRFASMMLALSFVISYLMVPRYLVSNHSHGRLMRLAWDDEEFLISATIAVVSLCAVMTWNNVFPDRRDSLILGVMPVRMRVMMGARFAAIATVLAGAVISINILTGFSFPFVLATGLADAIRAFATWWLTLGAAGVFVFCCALSVQGAAAQILPWRTFLRVSGLLQILLLFTALGFFFLTPPFDSASPPGYIPSFWFVGLLHKIRGDADPLFGPLAARAVIALAIVIPLAAVAFILSWSRNMRRIVESPEILPAKHARVANFLARTVAPAPFERAILQFAARTIARSRQHRLMLALYGGFGFSLVLAYVRAILAQGDYKAWHSPNVPFLIAGFLLLTCAVIGVRAIFALPVSLPSNWIFRITAVHRPAAYFAAVRKSLFTLAALPVWLATAGLYFTIWPGRSAIAHMAMLILTGVILVERALYQFRKIPFTCSWLPGGANRSMKAGVLILLFLIAADAIMAIELRTMETTARIVVFMGIFGAVAFYSRRRTVEYAADPYNQLQFEDSPPSEIYALDLRQDGSWSSDDAYVNAIDPYFGRSFAVRMRPVAAGILILILAGYLYERVGEWRDRRLFPQIGRSVSIGDRTMNIFCSGEGSPAVIFDAGGNLPGYSWALVQPQVAKFTRACWYDRAGYGWSDPVRGARTSAAIAEDLHKLLHAAGVQPPYVLAGYSFGGFNVRVFTALYRAEVAGLILADSADEYENPDLLPESMQAPDQFMPDAIRAIAAAGARFLVHIGVQRLVDNGAGPPGRRLTERDVGIMHAQRLQAKSFDATTREGLDQDQSAEQVRAIRSLGDIPLVVLTAGRSFRPPNDPEQARILAAWSHNWIYGAQPRLAHLSSRGKQYILEYSGHAIPFEAPEAVAESARMILNPAR
jgi:pimeloyl-ACP methyl ester carboxylesterase